jgi:hypothetical protein
VPATRVFYHRTTEQVAADVLAHGFRDRAGTYGTAHEYTGVWLSDRPLGINEGVGGEALLAVELAPERAAALDGYEWVEDGKGYREWFVPAEQLNGFALVREVGQDEEGEFFDDRFPFG